MWALDKPMHPSLQPPSGGCVLKLSMTRPSEAAGTQPPSGGCVLKQGVIDTGRAAEDPAAFRRLCVET